MSREKFNASADANKMIDPWEDVRQQYEREQAQKAERAEQSKLKAELEREEARKKALEQGAKDFEKRQNKFISRNNETNYNEYADLHNHLMDLENGKVEQEENKEFILSKEEVDSAIAASPILSKMDTLVKRINLAQKEEAKDKFRKELSELSNQVLASDGGLSVEDWHKDDQWKIMQDSKDYNYRSSIVNQIWEKVGQDENAKIRQLGESLGWSDEEINRVVDAFNNSGEANHDEDKKVDNPPTSLEEQFDEAVRNGASADELSKIRHEFYKEGQVQNGGKLELSEEYRDRYEIMQRVISAQREAERSAATDSDKKLDTEKPLTRREKLKKWGKRILYSAGVLLAVWGGKTVADNMQNNNSTEPTIDHVDKNQDKDQVANAKDEFNKFVADGETGAENLTNNGRYDKQNDTYWSQMNLKRNGEDIGNISTFGDKTPEQIMEMHRNGSLEDNLSYQAQFMFMDGLAEKYFGISANEAQDLYSRAQNGDQEAFKKINDGFEKMTAEVDRFEWAGNVPANFSSFFGDMDENGHITMSTAHGLNFEDKMLNMVLKDGTVVSIDGTCTQIIIKGAVVELPQIKGFTPPADVVIPPAITNPPVITTEEPKSPPINTTEEPKTTEAPKNRSKEDPGTYNGITPAEAGEETPAVSTEEQNNSVNSNAQPGDNVDGVMAPGAEPAPAQTEEVVVQYSGEWTVDPVVQQQQIQQQQAQEQANQNADQSAKVEEVQVGDQSVSLDEIRQAQQQTTTNGN